MKTTPPHITKHSATENSATPHILCASIAIIGLKHSGKTGHGRRLAEYARVPFFDLDDCILRAHLGNQFDVSSPTADQAAGVASDRGSKPAVSGQRTGQKDSPSIRSLYAKHGVEWFRREEFRAARAIGGADTSAKFSTERIILATGGGSMENAELVQELRRQGMVLVFFDQAESVLFERIMAKGIPPFLEGGDPQQAFHRLYAERRRRAMDIADLRINLGIDLGAGSGSGVGRSSGLGNEGGASASKEETFRFICTSLEQAGLLRRGALEEESAEAKSDRPAGETSARAESAGAPITSTQTHTAQGDAHARQ